MRRLRLLGLVLVAILAFGAAVAASASASERGVLTLVAAEKVEASMAAAVANKSKFTSGTTLTCNKLWILPILLEPSDATKKHFNLQKKGTDTGLHLSECGTSLGGKCNTPGDAKGVLLLLAATYLVNQLDKAGGKLIPGFIWLLVNSKLENKPITVECEGLLLEVTGAISGVAEPLKGGVLTLTAEVEEVGLLAKSNAVCDTENEKVCSEVKEKAPLLINIGLGFEALTFDSELFTMKVTPDVLWDD